MAVYSAFHTGAVSDQVAQAAVPNKRVRIRRMTVLTSTAGKVTPKQDVGGTPAALENFPSDVQVPFTSIDLRFGAEKPQTGKGKNLGYDSAIAAAHAVRIEYDVE
jgi:hypothetical protein